jgi:O-antigen ligase
LNLDYRVPDRATGIAPPAAASPPIGARERVELAAKWAAVLLGGAIPVSVAGDNILFAFLLLCWLAGGGYRDKLAAIRRNPVALAALALFAVHVVGALYSIGDRNDVQDALTKALRLLLIPALLPLMREAQWRDRGLRAFLGSMLVVLLVSCLYWSGALPVNTWLKGTELDPVMFKAHITHNVFMAFAAFLFALAAVEATSRRGRLVLFALSVAATVNVLVMVPGRTGHIVLLVLFTYFLYRQLRWKGLALAGLAVGVLAVVVALSPDAMLHKRITMADDEFQQWRAGVPADPTSSVGQRMGFLRNTLEIIRESPVVGVGTGGFAAAYAARASRAGEAPTRNPHNEFLMIAAQFGIVGLAVFACLFATQWWLAARLPGRFEQAAARGLVLTVVVASLLSSTLVDHAEGFFFVYMSGLLFAGCRAADARARIRAPARGSKGAQTERQSGASAAKRVV